MKSKTLINKILKDRVCSIETAEKLTTALHKEKLLPIEQALRFRPLYRDFDVVNASLFTTGKFNAELSYTIGNEEQLAKRFLTE